MEDATTTDGSQRRFTIGVDIGATSTDLIVLGDDGSIEQIRREVPYEDG